MPARRSEAPSAQVADSPPQEPGTSLALSLPDDIRADLLRTQAAGIQTPIDLVELKMLAAGACQFELTDEPGRTFPIARGIILHAHPSNVLWHKKYGSLPNPNDEKDKLPRCSSNDGVYGVPLEGFAHAGLPVGVLGDGKRTVECATCPYNQWNSGNLLIADKNPKGKAVTNNRKVYIMLEDRDAPVVLTIPPTSIGGFDEYASSLLNKGIPLQAVVTEFSQTRVTGRGAAYAQVHVKAVQDLNSEEFAVVMDKRKRYAASIFQPTVTLQAEARVTDTTDAELAEDEEIPF